MMDLIRRFEFRAMSYEDDTSSLVDMHRCYEVLEGGWFDDEVTARRHQKIVARASGSSWVLSCERMIFGYADLIKKCEGVGTVSRWRLHPDFRMPLVARKLLDGLRFEARKYGWKALEIFADTEEVANDMKSLGLKIDRSYFWANPADVNNSFLLDIQPEMYSEPELIINDDWQTFLGSPLPLRFILARAFMASSYGMFRYQKPKFQRLKMASNEYLACYDGREWYVFRRGRADMDTKAVKPILFTLNEIQPARIMLSEKAADIAEVPPASDQKFCDFYIESAD